MASEANDIIELKGSCLCGSHSYITSGEFFGFYHCHCKRCQKMSGTGHASNIMLKPAELELKGDRSRIGVFKVPDADRFASRFCKDCGGPVPRFVKETKVAVIPAGTLDHAIEFEPQYRIFWESRADWSCSDKKLIRFAEYPELE